MRSRARAALLLSGLFLLLSGLALRRWELISLLIPITVLLFLSLFLGRPPDISLRVSRSIESDRLLEGDSVWVELRILNQGRDLNFLEIVDMIPEGSVVLEGRSQFPLSIRSDEEIVARYRIRPSGRGRHRLGPVEVRWTDPTFMYSSETVIEETGEIIVLPDIHELKKCSLRPTKVRMHVGNIGSKILGAGSEFYCLRGYFPGDEMRRLNWKASARRGALVTNEYESERSGDVTIVLDARNGPGASGNGIVDAGVGAVASLSSHFLKEKSRVGAIIMGDVTRTVKPAFGRRQFHRIVDALLEVRPGEAQSLRGIWLALERYFSRQSLVIIITPLSDRATVEFAQELVRRGQDVVVVSPSPIHMEANRLDGSVPTGLAARLAEVRRSNIVEELRRYCQVIDWDPEAPLARHLMEVRGSRHIATR